MMCWIVFSPARSAVGEDDEEHATRNRAYIKRDTRHGSLEYVSMVDRMIAEELVEQYHEPASISSALAESVAT